MSMGQWDARSTKHSAQTFFNINWRCGFENCKKLSFDFACLTQVIRICVKTLKFNGILGWNVNETAFFGSYSKFVISIVFKRKEVLVRRGPRSSWTAGEDGNFLVQILKIQHFGIGKKKMRNYPLHSFQPENIFAICNKSTNSFLLCQLYTFLCRLLRKRERKKKNKQTNSLGEWIFFSFDINYFTHRYTNKRLVFGCFVWRNMNNHHNTWLHSVFQSYDHHKHSMESIL